MGKLGYGPQFPQLGRKVGMLPGNDIDISGATGPQIGLEPVDQGCKLLIALGWTVHHFTNSISR
jgi:hypothetical protein